MKTRSREVDRLNSHIALKFDRQCCRGVRQISEWLHNSIYESHGFETLRDLTIRRLIRYWNKNQSKGFYPYPSTLLYWHGAYQILVKQPQSIWVNNSYEYVKNDKIIKVKTKSNKITERKCPKRQFPVQTRTNISLIWGYLHVHSTYIEDILHRLTQMCVGELGHHWLKWWLV